VPSGNSGRGLRCSIIVDGRANAGVFGAFVNRALGPTLERGDIVVMHNVSGRTSERVGRSVQARGTTLILLPPCSHDYNPIEMNFFIISSGPRHHFRHRQGLRSLRLRARHGPIPLERPLDRRGRRAGASAKKLSTGRAISRR